MRGVNLTQLVKQETGPTGTVWLFTYPSIKVISFCSGTTRLANSYIFNLLSSYNPARGTGSVFRLLVAAPILHGTDKEFVVVLLSEELDALKNRFMAFQAKTTPVLPKNELLAASTVLGIDVSGDKAKIRVRLLNQLGQPVVIEV